MEDDSIDTVVEVMGGLHPAYDYVRAAIEAGKNVVTANKALVCTFYDELLPLVQEKGVCFRCTAAVGGGIGWLTGAVLLVGSLALLLFGLPLANIWVKLAAYIGVPVMMLSWAGCLIVFRRLRMSAAAYAQEKGKVLLP